MASGAGLAAGAADESRLAAWSSERHVIALFELPGGERRDLEVESMRRVLGFTGDGDHLLLDGGKKGVLACDLASGAAGPVRIAEPADDVRLDPTGRFLLTSEESGAERTVRIARIVR